MHPLNPWGRTRAGQNAFVLLVVKEDGGMPLIHADVGDLPEEAIAECMLRVVQGLDLSELREVRDARQG